MLETDNLEELLTALKADKTSADSTKATWDDRRAVWIKESNGEKYGNEVEGKASVVTRDIKKSEVWQHATIIDPFVSNTDMVRCSPISASDKPLSDQSETLLNHFFCREFDRYNFISEAFKIEQREGTVIARVGWEFQEREVEIVVPVQKMTMQLDPQTRQPVQVPQLVGYKKEIQLKTTINRPTASNRDNRTLWLDPTQKISVGDSQFIIENFKSSKSKLLEEGIYENLDDIEVKTSVADNGDATYADSETSFTFEDDARKELDVYEYWGNYDVNGDGIAEPIVCTWVGNTIIRLAENPYPDNKPPYILSANDPEPFSLNGRPNADLQSTDQKITTAITRSLMDTLDSSTNTQRGYPEQSLDPANERRFKARKDFKFRGDQPPQFWEGKYAEFGRSSLEFYQMTKQDQAELTGIKAFAGGDGKYNSATQANMAMGAVAKKEVDVSRNFAENFVIPLLRKWLSMIAEFMEPEEVERITGKPYVPYDGADPLGMIDIRIEVATAETDAAKASDISFMLQTMSASLPFDLTKILLSEQAELKKMPGLAKRIEEYQPQPNPLAQKREELEIQKLEAEIAERLSRAEENKVDVLLKKSQTVLNEAKSRELHGKADNTDLDFTRKASGQEFQEASAMEDQKARNKLIETQLKSNKQG